MMRATRHALIVLAVLAAAPPASAQDGPAGALHGALLASTARDFGGALGVDLWAPLGPVRLGGFFAVAALPSDDDLQNRVFMPLALSVAVEFVGEEGPGVSLRLRGGGWGGATQDAKLTLGGLVAGGAHLLYALGGGANISVGLDVWGLFGGGDAVIFAPSLGLSWTPARQES